MRAIAPADRVSLLTGEPFVAKEAPERYRRPAVLLAAVAHLGFLVVLALSLGRISQVPEGPVGFEPLTLVFAVEAGPGGGGGGGGEESSEPPSVRKAEGHDVAKVAVQTEKREPLHFEPEPPTASSLEAPESRESPDTAKVDAPVVSSAPDDVSRKGALEGTETLVESAGPGTGGGAGTGTGTGIGPGEGPGIGPGSGGGFGGGAYRMGSGVEPPVLRHRVEPGYTNEALQRKLEGSVTLEIVILRDGTVGPVRVTSRLDPGLDQNAIDAVRQWRFLPGKFRGQPVDVIAEVVVEFRLL
jgi:protein TonB